MPGQGLAMRPDRDERTAASERLEAGPALEVVLRRLAARARRREAESRLRGDHDLDPAMRAAPPLTRAAVLVPIIAHAEGPTVLFERRAPSLADHAGEICFPGGRFEDGDATPEQAALRELEEELGLPRSLVEIIGLLDPYETRTGFRVFPVVGLIRPPILLRPDPVEVAEVFEVPLAHLLEPRNYLVHRTQAGEEVRTFRAVPYRDYFIWGATAGILMNLCEWLREP
jgi:8-oxo-dGTP pyrophosphatase MutT (NUDIX family)